jgi:hypothetical protein
MTRSGLAKHLLDCPERLKVIDAANNGKEPKQKLYHLEVRDAYISEFWLHLEMNGGASLKTLDTYLRAIWLECCGHLSRFSVGGWGGNPIGMANKAERVFVPGLQLTHIYDFGTSSETLVNVVGVRVGSPTTRRPIALMARNNMPEITCMECDDPAVELCMECVYEHEETGALCKAHLKKHPHDDDYGNLPVVNSPRMGVCGYEGPAEPPY